MALRNYIPSQNHFTQYGEQLMVAGWFDIAAGGAVGTVSSGRGWSVAKTGTGEYTVTFEGPMYARLAFTSSAEDTAATPAGTDVFTQNGAWASLTQEIFTIEGGAVADPTAATRVHFIGVFRTRNAL